MTLFARIVVFPVALAFVCACSAVEHWRGDYRYEAAEGQTRGGTPIVVEYQLRIGEQACRLDIDGYQVDETIVCDAVAGRTQLEVRFKSYPGGSLTNVYDVQVYKPGEPLFVLSKRKGRLVTRWKSMYPGEQPPPDGFYFVRK
ncbi:MAG TPA: DUF5991 domain-containing protein [Gammaproteobacteria bacterium]